MTLPGKEITVSSWSDLVSKLHSHNIVQRRTDEGNHLRSPYVFRGMDVASWELLTSFQRLPKGPGARSDVIEHSLIRSFRKYATAGAFDEKSEWYVLAVAQHNGLPTRVLDWTASPFVGAHFACGDDTYKKEPGAIWCLNAEILREINEATFVKHRLPTKSSSKSRRRNSGPVSLRGIAWVYDTRLLERSFADLSALDSTYSRGPLLLLWEPPSLDSRIANQSGLLSIMNTSTESQNDFLLRQSNTYPDLVVRIVIDAKAKSEIRDMLDQSGISERTMFPGLPGLCDWLKRYYGKAW
jgi:hypothetical protein